MFDWIIRFSLRNRLFVVAVAALGAAYGGYILTRLPVDVFPDLNRPTVTIFTEAGGLAAEEVEALITFPIESAMNGAARVQRVRSTSSIGLSIVWVEFDFAQDIYLARQIVTERLQQVSAQLPPEAKPVLTPISSIMGEIMLVGVVSTKPEITPMDVRTIADWQIRPRLLSLSGISQIAVIGGEVKQYQVLVDPFKLRNFDISLHQVEEAVKNANVNSTGGFLLRPHTEQLVRNLARLNDLADLSKSVIPAQRRDALALTLGQVAEVKLGGPLAKRGDAGLDGQPAVILTVQKQPATDTVKLTRAVENELAHIQRGLPDGVKIHSGIFRQSTFIENAIRNVEEALRDGAILVALVLFIFLLNFRTTLITLTAIPLSILVTVLVFRYFGISINTMTLGGLAVAIGELVDDAIVDVENVFRRLRENRQLPDPRPALEVIYRASSEVRNSIVFATVIVVLVFIPLFALGGIEGQIFAPLGIAYITSILASLIVSLTVTPALCSYLLPRMKRLRHARDSWLVRGIKNLEAKVLALGFRFSNFVLLASAVVFLAALATVPFFGREFLPPFNEGSLTINLFLPPGSSLAESNRIASLAEKLVLQVPEVKQAGRRSGRAELDEHAEGVHYNEIDTELRESKRSREEILTDIRQKLDQIPGVSVSIGQPISHRIDHVLSGVRAQVAVKIFGPDLSVLRTKSAEVESVMREVRGMVDIFTERQVMVPQVHVRIDREQAQRYGVMAGEVAEYAQLAMQGKTVTQMLEGSRTFDVVLRLSDEARGNMDAIRQIPVDTSSGVVVPLGQVAQVEEAKGPNQINRENVQRRMYVAANVSGRDLVGAVNELQRAVSGKVELPPGYYITYGGQFESQATASRLITWLSLLSLIGMFVVLYAHFKSAMFALQIMLNIPMALIGSIAGIWLMGGTMSIATLVGLITLAGIAARNGIMMISHYLHLMREEGETFSRQMIVRGTQERLVPVLMTALTAGLALVPLILAAGEPGREILHPVAVVIFSGIFTSTLLDFIVTPLVFWRFGRAAAERTLRAAAKNKEFSATPLREAVGHV
jgi:CzcA family heavy metal efflux pump